MTECPVCLEECRQATTTKLSTCGHEMHTVCVNQLAEHHHVNCPLCRQRMNWRPPLERWTWSHIDFVSLLFYGYRICVLCCLSFTLLFFYSLALFVLFPVSYVLFVFAYSIIVLVFFKLFHRED